MSGTPSAPAPNSNPDCPNQPDYSLCRITRGARIALPVIEWEPIYDGAGTLTNSDPNTHIQTYQCTTCTQGWEMEQISGEIPILRKL